MEGELVVQSDTASHNTSVSALCSVVVVLPLYDAQKIDRNCFAQVHIKPQPQHGYDVIRHCCVISQFCYRLQFQILIHIS